MKRIALHWQIIIALVLGVVYAFIAIRLGLTQFTLHWIKPWGDIFIRLLKMLAVPLVLFSIIKGVSGLTDIGRLGRLGLKTMGAYVLTTMVAITIGLGLVNLVAPGDRMDPEVKESIATDVQGRLDQDTRFQQLEQVRAQDVRVQKDYGPLFFLKEIVPENIFVSLMNMKLMLQVIFFAVFFGIGLVFIEQEKAAHVMGFVDGANDVILLMIKWVMKLAPFFVFCLLAGQMAQLAGDDAQNLTQILGSLIWYMGTVTAALCLMMFVVYPLAVHVLVPGLGYRSFLGKLAKAQSVAFSTSSSAATLPVTMDVVENDLGVSKETTNFILPVGTTINMDGTSMFQAITAVFLAQFFAQGMPLGAQIAMVGMATLASIGAPAIPSAGLVLLMGIMESLGLQVWWVALVFPVDRILDMTRTAVNVTGDAAVATIIARSEGEFSSRTE